MAFIESISEKVKRLTSITDQDARVCEDVLEACNGNFQLAAHQIFHKKQMNRKRERHVLALTLLEGRGYRSLSSLECKSQSSVMAVELQIDQQTFRSKWIENKKDGEMTWRQTFLVLVERHVSELSFELLVSPHTPIRYGKLKLPPSFNTTFAVPDMTGTGEMFFRLAELTSGTLTRKPKRRLSLNDINLLAPCIDLESDTRSVWNPQHVEPALIRSDTLFRELIDDSPSYTQCPECSVSFEIIPHEEKSNTDLKSTFAGVTLSGNALIDFRCYRLKCRNCSAVFCSNCRTIPFHLGKSCTSNRLSVFFPEQDEAAGSCRYCTDSLLPCAEEMWLLQFTEKSPLPKVCYRTECVQLAHMNCKKIHQPCRHPCCGAHNEDPCITCLVCEQKDQDFCGICWTEELCRAPCLELQCGHIFHHHCLKQRLQCGQPTEFISFNFMNCPICSEPIEHPKLSNELEPVQKLQQKIHLMALERLKLEDLTEEPEIIEESGRFYHDELGYALHRYAFFRCHKCNLPYFGGLKSCADEMEEVSAEELICDRCSGENVKNCDIHGSWFMLFKCRFCCSIAQYSCWGNTHFCIECHRPKNRKLLVAYPGGGNKLRIDEYPECKGVDQCNLHIKHPPNGVEFALSCLKCDAKKKSDSKLLQQPPTQNTSRRQKPKMRKRRSVT